MRVENQIRAVDRGATPFLRAQRKEPFPASRTEGGCRDRTPATRCESPCRRNPRPARAFALARRTRAINQNVGVVHIALVAGTNLDRLHPTRLVNRHRKNKIPIRVGALRRKDERLRRRENHVGLAEPPAFYKLRLRRQIGRVAFDGSLLDPARDQVDFRVRQVEARRRISIPAVPAATEAWRASASSRQSGERAVSRRNMSARKTARLLPAGDTGRTTGTGWARCRD